MGVDHGGGDAGDKSPRIWRRGTLMQIAPLIFLSNRYKKEHSVAFKIRQNPFSAGALPPVPRTPLGELTTLPYLLVGWRGDAPPIPHPIRHRPTFGAHHASPSEFQPDLRLYHPPQKFSVFAWGHTRTPCAPQATPMPVTIY